MIKGKTKGNHVMENSKDFQALETRLNEQSYCTGKVLSPKEKNCGTDELKLTLNDRKGYTQNANDSKVK